MSYRSNQRSQITRLAKSYGTRCSVATAKMLDTLWCVQVLLTVLAFTGDAIRDDDSEIMIHYEESRRVAPRLYSASLVAVPSDWLFVPTQVQH
jgi:hypothetical protein